MLTRLIRGKVYNAEAKKDTSLDGLKGKTYKFIKGEKYLIRVYHLNLSDIIVDLTKLRVNTSWLVENFTFDEFTKLNEFDTKCK